MLERGVYLSVLTYNDGFIPLKHGFKKSDIKRCKNFLGGAYSWECSCA